MARLYAACLASYNSGCLHGAWIDVTEDADEMQDAVNAMLRASPYPNVWVKHEGRNVRSAEEWAVHDWDDETGAFSSMGETSDLKRVANTAAWLTLAEDELGDDGVEIVTAYWSHMGMACMPDDAADIVEQAREAYCGTFDSWEDWAIDWIESTGLLHNIPEEIARYFDFAAYGNDARCNGDIFEEQGHYFHAR